MKPSKFIFLFCAQKQYLLIEEYMENSQKYYYKEEENTTRKTRKSFSFGNSHICGNVGSLTCCSSWGLEESDTTE